MRYNVLLFFILLAKPLAKVVSDRCANNSTTTLIALLPASIVHHSVVLPLL